MALTLEQLEARFKLLEQSFSTLEAIDEARGAGAVTAGAGPTLPRGTAGSHIERMAAGARAEGSPEHGGGDTSSVTVTAACGARGIPAGTALTEAGQLGEVMAEALRAMQPTGSTERRQRLCASARWEYPRERQLGDDSDVNTRRIEAVCGLTAPRVSRHDGALVATGGICLPTNVDYSVPTWSTSERPLRDSLPTFQATRGGVSFVTPPDIGIPDLQGGTASGAGVATGIWSEATDASPAGATKPVWQVECGSLVEVYVDAVPTRVEFGNMQGRFAPEQVAANTEQAIATAAREAELNLLGKMYLASNQVLPQQYLGASRDVLGSVDLLREQYLHSHRIPRTSSFTAVFPSWAIGLLRSDIARELAHDGGVVDPMAVSDDQIDRWFTVRGINVIWTLDGLQAGTYGTGGYAIPAQYFAKITPGSHPQWPGQSSDGSFVLAWLLFPEGTFQFLDGGRLDLGVVRDSVLDATNDYETFVEPFESVAFRGVEAYQVQSTILPTGGSAATVSSTDYHE